ncbi:CvpA family protein [Paludibacterium purpuratum]|uniref:Membrane protein required for colicin V production n=1 Tax=Paludibacterium purpuratum TaxID=1144873 RepID=A0A4R7B127_9NEIS|nr:CvpA family protein [Paludibacterium purpuratum]TDR73016.1 membrane protein required for colicin V production [Paludibacterium purpuratum]
MTALDYVVIAILIGSVVVGLVRGLVVEVLSLGAWLIAFWCAKQFSPALTGFVPSTLASQGLRMVVAFLAVFFVVWLLSCLLRVVLTGLLDSAGLGGVNRLLGAGFGLARGALVLAVLTLIAGLTDLPREPVWRNALLAPPLEAGALVLKPWLPPILAGSLHYPDKG